MSCGTGGRKKHTYTGNQVGYLNWVGDYNFVSGGPAGSSLSAGFTVETFVPNPANRRIWLRRDVTFGDAFLDAAYPTADLQWTCDIYLNEFTFHVSDRSFYVQGSSGGTNVFYEARCSMAPQITLDIGEWLQPNFQVSDLMLSLNNRDGYFNQYLAYGANYRSWPGARIVVRVGFGEIYDNYMTVFEGSITSTGGLTSTRDTIEIRAYDKIQDDNIQLPLRVFNSDVFPDIDSTYAGKAVPLVYGDWNSEVEVYGNVNAICTNANEEDVTTYIFKVSDIALQSIDGVYLHRGNFKEDGPSPPVQLNNAAITLSPAEGQFLVNKGVDVLRDEITYKDTFTAGVGSSTDVVAAKDDLNFLTVGVQVGDRVLHRPSGQNGIVVTVAGAQLTLSGGVPFVAEDEYVIYTKKYAFLTGDKITVKCMGKSLNLVSLVRIPDLNQSWTTPYAYCHDYNYMTWVVDNTTRTFNYVDFAGVTTKSITFDSIDPAMTFISAVYAASDNFLWFVDQPTAKIYRYDLFANTVGLSFTTSAVTGIGVQLPRIVGLIVKPDNQIWIVDNDGSDFYRIQAFAALDPFVTATFTSGLSDIRAMGYDYSQNLLLVYDRASNTTYKLDESGSNPSSILMTNVNTDIAYISSIAYALDGTLFFLDYANLAIYNYNEMANASTNPALIVRDILTKNRNKSYAEYAPQWMRIARQLDSVGYKCRVVIDTRKGLVQHMNDVLRQFNCVFFQYFGQYSLFYIDFNNFITSGKLVKEKDIQAASFKPQKETNQYFNSGTATYNKSPYSGKSTTSDTYVSKSAIKFRSDTEINKKLDLPAVYRRQDIDYLMALYVRLAAAEPEFVDVTFGFRCLRVQMQDFLTVLFDGDINCATGQKESGRRFNRVPCMVRKLVFNLNTGSIQMKLWSLGTTAFPGYTPEGTIIGGYQDEVTLTSLGRLGRISPIARIAGVGTNHVNTYSMYGQDAGDRTNAHVGSLWQAGMYAAICRGDDKSVVMTLPISSVSGPDIYFSGVNLVSEGITASTLNAAGFVTDGHYVRYANYDELTDFQKNNYSSFGKPTSAYPSSKSQELEEQRTGAHNYDDNELPYILYPKAFNGG